MNLYTGIRKVLPRYLLCDTAYTSRGGITFSFLSENRAKNTMALYRHEAAQISDGINHINDEYLGINDIEKILSKADIENINGIFENPNIQNAINILQNHSVQQIVEIFEKADLKDIIKVFKNIDIKFNTKNLLGRIR